MSRALAAVALGVGLPGLAVGGVYLSGALSVDSMLPDTVEDFKQKGHKEGCVSSLFKGLSAVTGTGDTKLESNFFTSGTETDGCLVVNWNKDSQSGANTDPKWKGNIRFLWAAKGGDKGFVMFLVGKTGDKKVEWDGLALTLAKEASKGWTVKGTKEKQANKSFSNSSQENKFPRAGENLTDLNGEDFWGFFQDKAKLEHLQETTNMDEKSDFRWYWTWKGDSKGAHTLSGWSKDAGEWWKEIFGDDWKMKEAAETHKGAWTLTSRSGTYAPKPKASSEKGS